ncbi:hypothetical protein EGH24_03790 [Halonotius terrestris]|uniref:Uncharacterized protein n=1 Tax=Halonotius terrestris TaxID=2487750 RepID=A0A8J8PDG7_9EURY|nr:hypothetical protein [Halonotius terrestris]TQQ82584.1 hypothetical protein EGH24_03790 [Halonotius terrestris]
MGLQRVGVLLLTLGLLLATLSAVAFGATAGGTDVACDDHEPSYSLVGVDSASLSVSYTDGCNTFSVQPLVTAGAGLIAAGLLIGGVGIGRQRLNRNAE